MKFDEFVSRKTVEYGDKFDCSRLDERFIPYFNNGQRIKVKSAYGGTATGTVGVTEVWRPVFLLMTKSNSISSHYTLSKSESIIAVKKGRTYVKTEDNFKQNERDKSLDSNRFVPWYHDRITDQIVVHEIDGKLIVNDLNCGV